MASSHLAAGLLSIAIGLTACDESTGGGSNDDGDGSGSGTSCGFLDERCVSGEGDSSDSGSSAGSGEAEPQECYEDAQCGYVTCVCDGRTDEQRALCEPDDDGRERCQTAEDLCAPCPSSGSTVTSGSGESDGSGAGGPGSAGVGAGDSVGSGEPPTHPECEAFADDACSCSFQGVCEGSQRDDYVTACELGWGTEFGDCERACYAGGGSCDDKADCRFACAQ